MFERAYAYVNSNRHAIIRLYLDRDYTQIVNILEGNVRYVHVKKTGISRDDVLWRKPPQVVDELRVINSREIEVVLYELISSEVEIQIYDNGDTLNCSARINIIEGSASVKKEDKGTRKTLAISPDNKIIVWRDTYEVDFNSDSYIKAKILDETEKVVGLMGGYHVRKKAANSSENLGGLDVFKFFFKLESMTDSFYTFLYEIESSKEIFEEKLWFDSSKNFFVKELPEEEKWREYNGLL